MGVHIWDTSTSIGLLDGTHDFQCHIFFFLLFSVHLACTKWTNCILRSNKCYRGSLFFLEPWECGTDNPLASTSRAFSFFLCFLSLLPFCLLGEHCSTPLLFYISNFAYTYIIYYLHNIVKLLILKLLTAFNWHG